MAADLTQSFMGKHFEKVVLGAAVAVFLVALGWFVIVTESQEKVRNDVKRRVAEAKKRIDNATLYDATTKEELVALGIGQPVLTVPGFESLLKDLGASWDEATKWAENLPKPQEIVGPGLIVKTPPATIMPIEDLEVAVGRGTTSEPIPNPLAKLADAKTAVFDVAWAGVVGRFDLTAQLDEYLAGNAVYQPILISKVELQRREQKPDGTWSDWAAVPPAAPKALLAKLPRFPASPQDRRAGGEWFRGLLDLQAAVRRMPFYPLLAADPELQTVQALAGPIQGVEQPPPPPKPEAPAARPAETAPAAPDEVLPPLRPATSELPPWMQTVTPGGKTAEGPKVGTPEATVKHVMATLWVVDGAVEPGKTYQYQMRPSIANPVWSVATDEKDRWQLELTGEWSKPSKEVTIPLVNQFFFVGTFGGRPNLELHRWIFSQWVIVPSAQASVGAPVLYIKPRTKIRVPGGTETKEVDVDLGPGTLLVDIIRGFPYRPEGNPRAIPTNVLIYADAQGRLLQRIEWEDRKAANVARKPRENVVPAKPAEVGAASPTGQTPTRPVERPVTPPKPPAKTPPRR